METGNQNARNNKYRQFSLSMLMLLVTGIACFLGGHMHGYRQGFAFWDSGQFRSYTFYVSDLLPNHDGTKSIAEFDLLAMEIKNAVMPGAWREKNGKAIVDAVFEQSSLRVTANSIIIEEVERYLEKRRKSRKMLESEK